jgi:protein-L-isoaspartate O-methyltransferase
MGQTGSAKEHYDNHLGSLYSWMIGDFKTLVHRQKEEFATAGISERSSAVALDLGAGSGVQTVALSDMGYKVTAIDFNRQLIEELKANTAGRSVHIVEDDLLIGPTLNLSPTLIVCCGDTIAHLPDYNKLNELIAGSYSALADGGKMYLSFRDYSRELKDTDRFIPVKQDETRIFTCFLEFLNDRVRVTDILLHNVAGRWEQKISSYLKLRTTVPMIEDTMQRSGFSIVYRQLGRMNILVGQK